MESRKVGKLGERREGRAHHLGNGTKELREITIHITEDADNPEKSRQKTEIAEL